MDDTDYSNPSYIPQPAELASYLRENRPNDRERDLLLAWYAAPDHVARTQEIADALGLTMLQVNNAYGRLGRRVVNALDVPLPERTRPSHVFALYQRLDDGYWYSFMHDRVAQAIELLGWAEEAKRRFAGFYETADGSRNYQLGVTLKVGGGKRVSLRARGADEPAKSASSIMGWRALHVGSILKRRMVSGGASSSRSTTSIPWRAPTLSMRSIPTRTYVPCAQTVIA